MLVFESQKLPWLWLFCLLQPGLPWALLQKLIPIYLFFNQSQWNIFSIVSTMLRLTDECILWMSAIAAHCNLCQHAHVWICWYLNRHTLLTRSQLCSQQNINGRVLIKKIYNCNETSSFYNWEIEMPWYSAKMILFKWV